MAQTRSQKAVEDAFIASSITSALPNAAGGTPDSTSSAPYAPESLIISLPIKNLKLTPRPHQSLIVRLQLPIKRPQKDLECSPPPSPTPSKTSSSGASDLSAASNFSDSGPKKPSKKASKPSGTPKGAPPKGTKKTKKGKGASAKSPPKPSSTIKPAPANPPRCSTASEDAARNAANPGKGRYQIMPKKLMKVSESGKCGFPVVVPGSSVLLDYDVYVPGVLPGVSNSPLPSPFLSPSTPDMVLSPRPFSGLPSPVTGMGEEEARFGAPLPTPPVRVKRRREEDKKEEEGKELKKVKREELMVVDGKGEEIKVKNEKGEAVELCACSMCRKFWRGSKGLEIEEGEKKGMGNIDLRGDWSDVLDAAFGPKGRFTMWGKGWGGSRSRR